MHKFQSTGWPITWFTADQQSNSVNGVVRRFSIHLSLKAWRPVSVICPTHSSGSLFCIWTAVWIKPLSEECALEWKWRYSGLEGPCEGNTWHMVAGVGRWWVGSLYKSAATWRLWLRLVMANWEQAGDLVHSNNSQSLRLAKMSRLSTHPSQWNIPPDTLDLCFMDCDSALDVQFRRCFPQSSCFLTCPYGAESQQWLENIHQL